MLSYHNDPKLKTEAIESAKRHAKQDWLIKGTYGEMNGHFKGCSVGCDAFDITGKAQISPHSITAEYFGFPEWLERLRDLLFERLEDNEGWHVRFKEAVPVGLTETDFIKIRAKFLIFILDENLDRVKTLDISDDLKKQILDAISKCRDVHVATCENGVINESAARSAAGSARSAAESAESAAESARSAAWSAVWSAAWAAWAAARSAAESAWSAVWSARSAAYKTYADKLIELLRGES